MKIEIAAIRSRVGRRIFLLFVSCSLIPIGLMGYIAFRQVSTSLLAASQQRTAAAIKNYQMEIIEHLDSLDSDLRILAQSKSIPPQLPSATAAHWSDLQHRQVSTTWDGQIDGVALTAEQQKHLTKGETVVAVVSEPPAVTLLHYFPDHSRPFVLLGKANPSFLFNGSETSGEGEIIVQEGNGRVIYQSSSSGGETSGPSAKESNSGNFERKLADPSYVTSSREAFLHAAFSSDPWRITYRQNRADVLAPVKGFRTSFALILLLTLWMVLLLSSVQIRRTLAPLHRLRDAVTEFSSLSYEPVIISSKDEFGDLADSFNRMQQRLHEQFAALDDFNWGTLRALARAIDAKSRWTSGHSERVTKLAVRIAEVMKLPQEEIMTLHRGGLVHDIGKIGTPREILDKPGSLTPAEMEIMRNHVTVGASILEPIPAFKDLIPIVAEHHERFNGSGYPRGLAGPEISLHARILSVADVYDALISDRPYRAGLPKEQVVRMIVKDSGTQFDPNVVEAFVELLQSDEVGSDLNTIPVLQGELNAAN